MKSRVAVVVLNWNGLEDTLRCVTALGELEGVAPRLIVVDNGSDLSPRAVLVERFPDVALIENTENLGYAAGNNVGIRHAASEGAELIWVLNNDAIPEKHALAALIETAERHPRAGAVGSKVVYADRPDVIWATWGQISWLQSLVRLPGQGQRDDGRYDLERRVPWIPGCSILFRREAIAAVGLFDESFFAYHEDADWGARAAEKNWESWYTGLSVVRHAVHGSSGGVAHYGGFRKYLSARNSVLYARRHGSGPKKTLLTASILATLPFQYARRLASGEQAGVAIKVRGWRDGLEGRPIPFAELGLKKGSKGRKP